MPLHAILRHTYFDLSIADCNLLTKCRLCAAGDQVWYFSEMILKITNKTKHEMDWAQSNYNLARCKIERQVPSSVFNHNSDFRKGTGTWACLYKICFASSLIVCYICCYAVGVQGWVGSRAGGFEAEAEAMTVTGSRDRSRSQWLPF